MDDFQEFGEYLLQNGVHEDVAATRICSETFLDLSEWNLKELAPTVGNRIRLKKILEEVRKVRLFLFYVSSLM